MYSSGQKVSISFAFNRVPYAFRGRSVTVCVSFPFAISVVERRPRQAPIQRQLNLGEMVYNEYTQL